jgi:hypothetical protein
MMTARISFSVTPYERRMLSCSCRSVRGASTACVASVMAHFSRGAFEASTFSACEYERRYGASWRRLKRNRARGSVPSERPLRNGCAPHTSLTRTKTSLSILSVSRPVRVFCWLG